jgi:hypothetical protein
MVLTAYRNAGIIIIISKRTKRAGFCCNGIQLLQADKGSNFIFYVSVDSWAVRKGHMQKADKRIKLGRSKGYLHATGPQFRFILFLLVLLICYTILLRVFQKLAEIVQLPVFLPISLVTLLVFIGIGGVLYSHTFVGPINRIRRALEHIAEGDMNIALRLRDSDDPMLKDLVSAIMLVCDRSRTSHTVIRDASRELFQELSALQDGIQRNADPQELSKLADGIQAKRDLLDKAIKSFGKS